MPVFPLKLCISELKKSTHGNQLIFREKYRKGGFQDPKVSKIASGEENTKKKN